MTDPELHGRPTAATSSLADLDSRSPPRLSPPRQRNYLGLWVAAILAVAGVIVVIVMVITRVHAAADLTTARASAAVYQRRVANLEAEGADAARAADLGRGRFRAPAMSARAPAVLTVSNGPARP